MNPSNPRKPEDNTAELIIELKKIKGELDRLYFVGKHQEFQSKIDEIFEGLENLSDQDRKIFNTHLDLVGLSGHLLHEKIDSWLKNLKASNYLFSAIMGSSILKSLYKAAEGLLPKEVLFIFDFVSEFVSMKSDN